MNTRPNRTTVAGRPADPIRSRYRFRSIRPERRTTAISPERSIQAPAALITRPGRRFVVTAVIFLTCAAGITTTWDSLTPDQAYGVITGNITCISAPNDGVLTWVHVQEGDHVKQDSRLATVCKLDCEQSLARVADELRTVAAELHTKIAHVQWESPIEHPGMSRSVTDQPAVAAVVHESPVVLGVIRNELARTHARVQTKAITADDVIQAGDQQDRLSSIQTSLQELKIRAEAAALIPRLGTAELAPLVARIDKLLHEAARIRTWKSQAELRATVDGRILQRHLLTGEDIEAHQPLFSILDESSLEIEMYLPIEMTAGYKVGDVMSLRIDSFDQLVPCKVTSIGSEPRRPPGKIERYYRKNAKLLAVRVRPPRNLATNHRMSVGAVARLPHCGTRG